MNDKRMDNASRSAKINRRKSKKKGGSAAPHPPAGPKSTKSDKATNNEEKLIYKKALGKAKSLINAVPTELQQAILKKQVQHPPKLLFSTQKRSFVVCHTLA